MWCYQKPGFEVLLLAELQRQQQRSQFCDTLLKADGVSVPAHSCILSAISPHISSTLSSLPVPPAGQSRLLDFRALGACTLLHMVRLLYSGEMAGEGEKEKQEAISAAARLGIHGLVEVKKRGHKSENEEGGGQHTEVGVQTEPLMSREAEPKRSRWRRDIRDGSTVLWKEILSESQKDMWTQTEELQVNTAPSTHPAASFETIEVTALQGLGDTNSHFVTPQIPCVPLSIVYTSDQNHTSQPSSAPAASVQDSIAAGHTSVDVAQPYAPNPPSLLCFPNQLASCAVDPQGWWANPQGEARDVTEGEEWDERFEVFQGNIPGFISYFLNPDKEQGSRRGRARRRRRAGVGGVRRAGTSERRARRPRARTGGRGRGGLTQMVDVQDVGVRGGGAVGRKLYLETREFLKPAKKTGGRGKVWELSDIGDVLPHTEGGGRNTQRGRKKTVQQFNQESVPVCRAQRARAKPTASVSFSSIPMQFCTSSTLSASGPSIQPSPSPNLLLPAASYVPSASTLLHTTALPPPSPPPNEEQPEHIDRLLEEVMMGLDILPNSNAAPHSQCPPPPSSSSCTYTLSGNNLAQSKEQRLTPGVREAGAGNQSTQVVAVERGSSGSSSANGEVPVLQQQGEGELNEILNHFLQSFEQHVESCSAREEEQMGGESTTKASQPVLSKYRKTRTQPTTTHIPHRHNTHAPDVGVCSHTQQQRDEAEMQPSRSQSYYADAHGTVPPEPTNETSGKTRPPAKQRRKRRKKHYRFSLERGQMKVRKPEPLSNTTRIQQEQQDKQLQQMPVVKLERSGPLQWCLQSQEVHNPAKAKTSLTSVKDPHDSWSKKNPPVLCSLKKYPIRSRLKNTPIMNGEPLLHKPPSSTDQPGRLKNSGQPPSLCNVESSPPSIQPLPVDPCGVVDKNRKRQVDDLTVQPQEEAEEPTKRAKKRGAEPEEETSNDATVVKRICFEQIAQQPTETSKPRSESAATVELQDAIDVETVSLTSVGDKDEGQEGNTPCSEIPFRETTESLLDEEIESSGDEIIDVDGDSDGIVDLVKDTASSHEKYRSQCRTAPALSHFHSPCSHSVGEVSPGSAESWEDKDIDVIGGSSPIPEPVIISWTQSSKSEVEEGDEDVDVVEEKTDYASPGVSALISKGELGIGKHQTVLLH
ncbi:uncharacterized protein LOC113144748 [Mastacembelus armatus]|uniref:uncharacterized protein LOC113144748 n=1 Tax=Mastacembelus armatus TaxID=205130 RepID=UPI000E460D89|nr:BTB/POZ domain-containing protein 18 [Mastacembelus armatus]